MLAVDPSSRRSGGSLLGDRARIDFDPADRGVLIRSTAAGERLGGLARATRAAAQALAAAFDVVVIETVGVGQAETEIAEVADTVVVVVQPGSGDVLQFLKSGIMEIPDVLVVTKADLGQIAMRTRRDLSAALRSLGLRGTTGPRARRLLAAARAAASTSWSRRWRSTAPGSTWPRAACARAARARWRTSSREHGERGLRALGGRRAARGAARRAGARPRGARARGGLGARRSPRDAQADSGPQGAGLTGAPRRLADSDRETPDSDGALLGSHMLWPCQPAASSPPGARWTGRSSGSSWPSRSATRPSTSPTSPGASR